VPEQNRSNSKDSVLSSTSSGQTRPYRAPNDCMRAKLPPARTGPQKDCALDAQLAAATPAAVNPRDEAITIATGVAKNEIPSARDPAINTKHQRENLRQHSQQQTQHKIDKMHRTTIMLIPTISPVVNLANASHMLVHAPPIHFKGAAKKFLVFSQKVAFPPSSSSESCLAGASDVDLKPLSISSDKDELGREADTDGEDLFNETNGAASLEKCTK